MLAKITAATESFRRRYGAVRGSLLWLELLKEKVLPKGEAFAVHVPGMRGTVYLRSQTSDVECFCQIFVHRELDIDVEHEVGYLIDAGANIGLSSVYLANRFPRAQIDALEVDQRNLDLLRRNVGKYPTVRVIPKGLWHRSCTLKIVNPEAEPWAFRVAETCPDDKTGFAAVSISELLHARNLVRVDLLKMDIEGAEKEVFEASQPWIDKVGTLLVELHDRFKPGCSEAVNVACTRRRHVRQVSGEYQVFSFRQAS